MDAQSIAQIYSNTAIVVGIILSAAALGSALGWGLICSKFLEGITRQPEMRAQLTGQMLFTGGLMGSVPNDRIGYCYVVHFRKPIRRCG